MKDNAAQHKENSGERAPGAGDPLILPATAARVPGVSVPVFADPGHRRKQALRLLLWSGLFFALFWFMGFSASIYLVEKLPGAALVAPVDDAMDRLFPDPSRVVPPNGGGAGVPVTGGAATPGGEGPICPPGPAVPGMRRHAVHLAAGRDWSGDLLARECGTLAEVYADLVRLDLGRGQMRLVQPELAAATRLRDRLGLSGAGMRLFPVVYLDPPVGGATSVLDDPAARAVVALGLADFLRDEGHDGLCLEAAGLTPRDAPGLRALLIEMETRIAPMGGTTCLILPAASPLWRDPALAAAPARLVIQMFGEGAAGAGPAPLAPQDWVAATLAEMATRLDPARVVLALGAFGRQWTPGAALPENRGFAEAMARAGRPGGAVSFAPVPGNTLVTWTEPGGAPARLWLLDAASFHNQMQAAAGAGFGALAVWSAGMEDPGVWSLLAAESRAAAARADGASALVPPDAAARAALAEVRLDHQVVYQGRGPLLALTGAPTVGRRLWQTDPATGRIIGQGWPALPRPYVIERRGHRAEPLILLSFDDGPDPAHTPAILDILRDRQAPAVFFTLGQNVLAHPDLARRILREGHEIGSHTFFHTDTDAVGDLRLKAEMNALQRLVRAVTGQGTVLYRTPYGRGLGPASGAEARPFRIIGDLGYITVGSDIVPPDWQSVTADQIVAHSLAALEGGGGQVIVLHDAGGDRHATVEALPALIDGLRAAGYRLVSLSEWLDVPRERLLPPQSGPQVWFDRASFAVLTAWGQGLNGVFWLVVLAGLLRAGAVLILSLIRRAPVPPDPPFLPPVTVLLPAFNEEAGIVASIRTVLASDYPDLRVIVIDDGSTDRTAALVRAQFGAEPRLTLIQQENAGKWRALDRGYDAITTEFAVALDADTVLAPDAIRHLMQPFADPRVGAVAGMVRVADPTGWLGGLQELEYVTAQNVDRRAAALMGAIMVVPGAIGAWRVAAVRAAGLYRNDTLTEDADLTVAVHRAGYRVGFADKAWSVTEVPATVDAFLRQRLRWTLGMMQTAWKHRGALAERRAVGWIALPDLALFGVVLGLLAPLADLVFVAALFDLVLAGGLDPRAVADPAALPFVLAWLALPLMDALVALVAVWRDPRARVGILWRLPLQRLIYRPLLYLTVWRAVGRALSGRLADWGRQVRRGQAALPGA